jgi:MYXO-CTERM domain-containing protein
MHMDPMTGMVNEQLRDPGGVHAVPIVYDQWVEIRVDFDLDADTVDAYYNGAMIATGSWTSGSYPTLAFANVDLYAPHGEPVFYDDLSLVPTPGVLAMLGMAGLIGVRRRRT